MEVKTTSEFQAVIDAARKFGDADAIEDLNRGTSEQVTVLTVPDGRKVLSLKPFLDEYLTAPERRKGTATHTTLASFTAHVQRFAAGEDTTAALFADVSNPKAPRLVAVLNYHTADATAWGDHRSVYEFPLSEEWKSWAKMFEAGPLSQADFAAFLEDHLLDVLDPSATPPRVVETAKALGISLGGQQEMLALSRGLTVRVDSVAAQAVNLSSGEGQILWTEEHKGADGKALKVPGGFVLAIPVFRGGDVFSVPVRLRYRVSGGRVLWTFVPHRIDRAFDTAVAETCDKAGEVTSLPLFYGTPEK